MMSKGTYTRDFYFIPTILFHDGDGVYWSLEIAWLKWYVGICADYKKQVDEE